MFLQILMMYPNLSSEFLQKFISIFIYIECECECFIAVLLRFLFFVNKNKAQNFYYDDLV